MRSSQYHAWRLKVQLKEVENAAFKIVREAPLVMQRRRMQRFGTALLSASANHPSDGGEGSASLYPVSILSGKFSREK